MANLGKSYRLGERDPYRTLRDALGRAGRRGGGRLRTGKATVLWALRHVDFDVAEGEAFGIVGRNGSGKSTLLKILSRITEPAEGFARVRGRVGSLLEVGTGFHPELTGRENVHLNGAILGMRRAEIARKYDEIVEFAELGPFMSTPVKRYSSGMYMRLAFAVAAHLEPEILMIDEVLAVGDANFQRKCLGKMGEVARGGRTVVFVSHNMTALESLCQRAIWLKDGQVVEIGAATEVVSNYLQHSLESLTERHWPDPEHAPGAGTVRLHGGRIRVVDDAPSRDLTTGSSFDVEIDYWSLETSAKIGIAFHICNERGDVVFRAAPDLGSCWQGPPPSGLLRDVCRIPGDLLNEGTHRIDLYVMRDESEILFVEEEFLSFRVRDDLRGRGSWYGRWVGAVRPRLEWSSALMDRAGAEPNLDRRPN